MALQQWSIFSYNIGGLSGKNIKYIVKNWVQTLKPTPLIIGLQELKTSFFLTSIAMNVIQLDYNKIISLSFEGKGGVTLLYHPSLS